MQFRRVWASALWLSLCACGPGPEAVLDAGTSLREDAGPPEDLDGFIRCHMAAGGLPGAAAAIVKDGEIAWVGTYGYADVAAGRAVDQHTLFPVASISKTMAVTRAMQLVEQGALDLDAPVETYLPYPVRHPRYEGTPITLRMLLTHTSGLEDSFLELAEGTFQGSDPPETIAAFAQDYVTPGGAHYSASNWSREPGTRRAYCNAAFAVIGDVIERAGGGESFRAQTAASILEPLQMDGAGWFYADLDPARLAVAHGYNGSSFVAQPQIGYAFYPASSLHVSVVGLARFLLAIAGGGALDGARVLDAESVDEMLRPQVPSLDDRQALTFSTRRIAGHLYIGHRGATYGGSAQMMMSIDRSYGILLLTNSDAYVRDEFGFTDGSDAMDAILERLDARARSM